MLQRSKLHKELTTYLNPLEHTMINTDQFVATNKANFDTLMGLTAKAFDGVEQLTALNLQVVKASLDEAAEAGRAVLSAKDPQALMALQAALLQPNTDKAAAYGKQVSAIAAAVKADVEKVAGKQAAAAQSAFAAMVETAGKNAPAGSEQGVEMFKQAMATATNALDSMQKAGRQVAETAEANYAAVASTVAKTAAKGKRG